MKKSKLTILGILFSVLALFVIVIIAIPGTKKSDMKSQNAVAVKYLYNVNPFYVHWKKHTCPKCGEKLKTAYDSVVVNSDSPEAKDYDFSAGDSYLTGDVEFRTSYFRCPNCEFKISFDEMKKLEKEK